MEFCAGLFFGGVGHPRKLSDVLVQRAFNRLYDVQHALFALRRKSARHIGLAQRIAQSVISGVDATPPARRKFRRAGQRVVEEIEILIDEGLAEIWRGLMRQLPLEIHLPMRDGMLLDGLLQAAEEIRRGDKKSLLRGRMDQREITLPVERRRQLLELRQSHLVVDVLGIAALHHVHGRFGQLGFHLENNRCVRSGLGRRFARELEHVGKMRQVLLAHLNGLGVVIEIEIAAGHGEAALVELRHGLLRVVIILDGREAEHRREGGIVIHHPCAPDSGVLMGELIHKLRFLLQVVNAFQFELESFCRSGFNLALIHAARPVVADLLFRGGASLLLGRGRFQRLAHHGFIPLEQRPGDAPSGLVGRNGIGGKKFAASVLIKVRTGIDLRIDLVGAQVLELGQLV